MIKVFSKEYRVKHNDTDFSGLLSIASLGNFVLDTAGLHAIEIKTSMEILNKQNLTWVITGMHFNIIEMPKINSEIKITTKITETSRLACKRDFFVEHNQKIIAQVSTEWLIINCETRRPVFLTDILPHINNLITPENQIDKYHHLRFQINEKALKNYYSVAYSDIDINKHLYSMRYIELAMNTININYFSNHKISTIDINFMSEILYGENIEILTENFDNIYHIEMQNSEHKPMFRAEIVWK
ncbi:MAG: thioesterase [Bacteroidales bacterium]|nr:thioesterase [Bacteroidales bacterium]